MTNEEKARFFNNARPFIQGNPNLRDPPKADPPRKAGRIDQHGEISAEAIDLSGNKE